MFKVSPKSGHVNAFSKIVCIPACDLFPFVFLVFISASSSSSSPLWKDICKHFFCKNFLIISLIFPSVTVAYSPVYNHWVHTTDCSNSHSRTCVFAVSLANRYDGKAKQRILQYPLLDRIVKCA